ncbi:MAG: hypothetical protein JNK92_04490 [Dechloromonas sp.]|nr:hypothetical protein [Dechloromonas sp.]
MPDLPTEPIAALQNIKGIDFPADVRYRQILVTGPPGAGKSTLITRLGGVSVPLIYPGDAVTTLIKQLKDKPA